MAGAVRIEGGGPAPEHGVPGEGRCDPPELCVTSGVGVRDPPGLCVTPGGGARGGARVPGRTLESRAGHVHCGAYVATRAATEAYFEKEVGSGAMEAGSS